MIKLSIPDIALRGLETPVGEGQCPPPVALRVCHISRMHTLKQYQIMPHSHKQRNFYFSPRRDVIMFGFRTAEDYRLLHLLKPARHAGLELIETALVMDFQWPQHMEHVTVEWMKTARSIKKRLRLRRTLNSARSLSYLEGLKTVKVLARTERDLYEIEGDDEREWRKRNGVAVDEAQGESKKAVYRLEDYAERTRAIYAEIVARGLSPFTATRIEVIDREGRIY